MFFDLLQMKSKWNKMYAKMLATLRRSQRLSKRQYWTSHAKDTSSRTIEQKDESALLQYSYSGSATVFLRYCYSTATVICYSDFATVFLRCCYSTATVILLQWFATVLLQCLLFGFGPHSAWNNCNFQRSSAQLNSTVSFFAYKRRGLVTENEAEKNKCFLFIILLTL